MDGSAGSTRNASIAPPPEQLRGSLGAWSVIFMVVAAAAPLTVVGSIMPMGFLLGNGAGFPVMFLVATAILLLFSVGLVAMSRNVPDAGAFFSYIAHGLGSVAGAAAATTALVCYTTVQVAVFAYFGATVSGVLTTWIGLSVPWWAVSLLCVAAVAVLGYRRIELSSRVLIIVLALEVAIVVVMAGVILATGGADGVTWGSFQPATILSGSPGLGLMFAVAGFIGFESTVVYRSEVRDPDRTIARATFGSAIGVGVFYAFAAWAIVVGVGESQLTAFVGEDYTSVLARVADRYLGPVGSIAIAVLLVGSMFAAVLSLHNVLTRYLHSMGHARLLPRAISTVHPRHGSPSRATIVQALSAAVLIAASALFGVGADLVFAWFAGIGSLAIILLMGGACVSVIAFFSRGKGTATPWQAIVAPTLGAIGLAASAWLVGENFPLLVGDTGIDGAPSWGPLSVTLLAVVVAAPVAGAVHALVLKTRRPQSFSLITQRLDSE